VTSSKIELFPNTLLKKKKVDNRHIEEVTWNLASDFAPPGGHYRNLPIWANSAQVHEVAFDLLRRHAPPPVRVIDLGAGSGAFTRRLLDHGYPTVEAVEMRVEEFGAEGVAVHRLNLDGAFGEKGLEPADALVALEIIEHLENPWQFGRQCAQLVRPGGILVISTPNIESARSRIEFLLKAEFRFFDEKSYKSVGHITALTSRTVRCIFGRAGFEFVDRTYDLNKKPRPPISAKKAYRWLLHWISFPFMKGDKRGEISLFVFRRPKVAT